MPPPTSQPSFSAGEAAAYAAFLRDNASRCVNGGGRVDSDIPALKDLSVASDQEILGNRVSGGVVIAAALYGAFCLDDERDAAPSRSSAEEASVVIPGVSAVRDAWVGNTIHKIPKNTFEQLENHSLTLQLCVGLNLHVINVGGHDLLDAKHKPNLVMGLLWQMLKAVVLRGVASQLREALGVFSLNGSGSSQGTGEDLPPEALLLLWFNHHLQLAGLDRRVSNFASDLSDSVCYAALLHQLDPEAFSASQQEAVASLSNNGPNVTAHAIEAAEIVLAGADRLGCRKFITSHDIAAGNPRLNLAFVATLFHRFPALSGRVTQAELEKAEVLTAEVDALRSEAVELRSREAMLAAEKVQLQAEAAQRATIQDDLSRQLAAAQEEIAKFVEATKALEAHAAQQTDGNSALATRLADVEARFSAKEVETKVLSESLAARERDLAAAQADSAEILAAKDKVIAAKQADIAAKEEAISTKDADLAMKDGVIAAAYAELASSKEILSSKETELSARDAVIETKNAELLANQETIRTKESDVAAKNKALAEASMSLERTIADYTAVVSAKDGQISQLDDTLKSKDNEIARLLARISELEAEVSRLQAELARLHAELDESRASGRSSAERVAALQTALADKEAEMAAALEKAELERIESVMAAEADADQARKKFVTLLESTTKEGWLFKLSPAAMKGWQKRWFVLKGSQLLYYKDPKDKRPAGVIECAFVKCYQLSEAQVAKAKFPFELAADESAAKGTKNFKLNATSEDDRRAWMQAISKAKAQKIGAQAETIQSLYQPLNE